MRCVMFSSELLGLSPKDTEPVLVLTRTEQQRRRQLSRTHD